MTVNVSVVADKSIAASKELVDGKAGKPVRIKAIKGGKYLLADSESGIAPENITVKRVGKNLHVALEGRDPDHPELIIEDFFGNEGQLVGQAEDGAYYEYIAVDGNGDSDVAFLLNGVSSPLALGGGELMGFADGLVVAGGGVLPWALAGLGLIGAGVAIDRHNSGGKKPVGTNPPENKGIGQVVDDQGSVQGDIAKGGVTDDDRPTLGGKGQVPGDTVTVIDNGKVIGETVVDGNGNWSFTPEKGLEDGEHSFEVVIKDPEGNVSDPSDEFTVVIDTAAPAKPVIESVVDDQGAITGVVAQGQVTDDATPALSGKAEAGSKVHIYANGKLLATVLADAKGAWNYTPVSPLSDGEYKFTVTSQDQAGNISVASDVYAITVDTVAPTKPGSNDAELIDDAGAITGPILNGSTTDDSTPTYNGKAEPDSTVVIYDNGKEIGRAPTNDKGEWTFTPAKPLDDGAHSLNYQVVDKAGNVGEKSDVIDFIVDTIAPIKPRGDEAELLDDAGSITGPIVSGSTTDDNTPTYTGNAEPNATVVIFDNGREIGRAQTNGSGDWTFTPSTPLADGAHGMNYQVIDTAGNVGQKSDVIDFIVDTVAPTKPTADQAQLIDDAGSIKGPIASGSTTDDNTPTYQGKTEPNATVVIYDDGKEIGRALTNGNGEWTFTPSTPLTDGAHSLNYLVVDKAGNVGVKSDVIDFIVDTNAPSKPTIETVYDDQGDVKGNLASGDQTDDAKPEISGTGEPNTTVIIKDGNLEIGRVPVGDDGKWKFEPSKPLGLGPHEITAVPVDAAGNVGVPSDGFDLIVVVGVPPAPPAIIAVVDDVGDVSVNLQKNEVTNDARPEVQGTAQAGVTVSVYVDGTLLGTTLANAKGEWSFTPSSDLADGLHNITATATNSVGNVSDATGIYPIVVDTQAPDLGEAKLFDDVNPTLGEIVDGSVTDDTLPEFIGKAEPGATVIVYNDYEEIGRTTVDPSGNWSFIPTIPLEDAEHSFSYKVMDAAGNVSDMSDLTSFTVDSSAIDASISEVYDDEGSIKGFVGNGGVTDDAMPELRGVATAGSIVKIYDGEVLLGQTTAGADRQWSFIPNVPLSEGAHTLQVTATTEAKGESDLSSPFEFTVDLSAPSQPTIVEISDDVGSIRGVIADGASTDDTTPTLKGQAEAGSTVHIYDNGSLIASVKAGSNGQWTHTVSPPLINGPHGFTVTSQDKAGNTSEPSDVYGVVVDTVAPGKPVIETVYDDQGDVKGNLTSGDQTDDAKPEISGTAEPNSTVIIRDKGFELGRASVGADGKWTFVPVMPLGKGDHMFTAEAVDAAGNVGAASDGFNVILVGDEVPAVPAITGVIDNVGLITGNIQKNGVTDDARPEVQGTAQAGMTVSVYADGKLLGTVLADAKGDWSFTPSTDLADGLHNITATATNSVGNVSPKTGDYPLIVDTLSPTKPGVGDAELVDNEGQIVGAIVEGTVTDDNTPTFEGKTEPNAIVVIYDNGQKIGSAQANGNGEWKFTPSTPLVDGKHGMSYEVVDQAGNVSEKSDPIGFIVDTKDVVIKIESASDNVGKITGIIAKSGVTDDATPTLSGVATANGVVKVYEGSTLLAQTTANADGKWSLELPSALSEGPHNLTATVTTESKGESDPSTIFDLTVDLTAPGKPNIAEIADDVGSIQGVVGKGQPTDDSTPTLKGSAEAGSTVHIYDNGSLLASVVADANGSWSHTLTTPLNNGPHDFTVTSQDKAGNTSVASDVYGVVVDTIAPGKPVIETVYDDQGDAKGNLASGDQTDDAKPEISGTAEPNSTVIIRDKGVEIGRAPVGADGKWTFEPSLPLGKGDHTFTAEAVDAAGNVGAASDGFDLNVVNDDPPQAPAITGVIDDVGGITGNIQKNGITDDARPEIQGTAQAGMTVSVYVDGKLLGTVLADAKGEWSFTPSTDLADGLHNITATATNSVGNVSPKTGDYPLIVDTLSPTKPGAGDAELEDNEGQIVGAIVDGTVTDDSTPTFTGKSEPNATVVIYDNGQKIGSAQTNGNGEWSFTPSTPLVDGKHSMNYEVVDKAGNVSEKSDPVDFTVDTKDVTVSIQSVTDNVGTIIGAIAQGGVTDDATPTLHGKATANGTVKIYEGSVLLGQTTADANGQWSFTPGTALSEGLHSLTATVTTVANGESAKTPAFDLTVDLTAPGKPSIESIVDDVGNPQGPLAHGQSTDDTTPTLSGKAEAGSTVHIYDNGSLLASVTADANGKWSHTPTTPLNNGPHDFTVISEDKAGNTSVPSDVYGVVVDTVAPGKPVIVSVEDDQGDVKGNLTSGDQTDDAKPEISGTAEPNSTVIIRDKGVEIGRAPVGADGKWTFEPSLPLGKGDHTFTAEAVDAAGNVGAASDGFDLNVVNDDPPQAPAITGVIDDVGGITGNIQKLGVTDDARPEIKGTAQPGMTVSVYADSKLLGTVLADAKGEWSFTPSTDLADGLHNITATATNSVGNVSPETGEYLITVDTTAPGKPNNGDAVLSDNEGDIVGAIVDGTVTDDSTPTFTGKSEPDSTVVIYDDGKKIGQAQADKDGNWTFTPTTPLPDGDHSLSYEVVDKAGNVSEKSDPIDFVVDTSDVEIKIEGATDNVGKIIGAIAPGGVTDDTTPTLHGKATANGTVKIYEGSVLLGQTTADANGQWSFAPGTALSEGLHSLTATVTTVANGESAKTPAFDLTVDLTAPGKPSIESIMDDVGNPQGALAHGQSTDDTTPTLSGKAEAGSTVHIYDNGSLLASVTADANGKWSHTPTTPLNNGPHDFTVTSQDKAGNTSAPADVYGVVVDTVAPGKPVIVSVEDDQGDVKGNLASGDLTDDSTPKISGTAEPNSTVIIHDKGVEIGRAPVGADGKWAFEPSQPLLDGEHDFTVVNVDAAGNQSIPSDPYKVITDTTGSEKPTITMVTDNEGAKQGELAQGEITDDLTPEISGKAEPNSTVIIWDNNVKLGQASVDANGDWTFVPTAGMQLGSHSIHVTAIDAMGNVSESSEAFGFTISTVLPTAPTISNVYDNVGRFEGVIRNGGSTDDVKPTVRGSGAVGEKIEVSADGVLLGSTVVDASGRWSFTPDTGLSEGPHVFSAVSVNGAGIPSQASANYLIKVDTVAPDAPIIEHVMDDVGTWTGELTNGQYTDDRRPTFSGKAEAFSQIIFYDNGEEIGNTHADANGDWTYTVYSPLSYGQHVITVQAVDLAYNMSADSEEWLVVIGDVSRSEKQAEGFDAPLSIQSLLVDGDAELLFTGMEARGTQVGTFSTLDVHEASSEWLQTADSFDSASRAGFEPAVSVMQDATHQLENPLIG